MTALTRSAIAFLFLSFLFYSGSATAGVPRIITTIRADTVKSLLGWHIVPVGDQNSDGYDDILIWERRDTLSSVALYLGGNPPTGTPVMRINDVNMPVSNIGDINSDGYDDFTMLGRSSFGWKHNLYYGGPTFDTIRDLWFGLDTMGTNLFVARGNDINANGNDDIIIGSVQARSAFLYELGTDSDSTQDMIFRRSGPNSILVQFGSMVLSGDFNGDDTTDLIIAGFPQSMLLEPGELHFYWGGVAFDTLPDMMITRPGGFQTAGSSNFGRITRNLRDVNGDGFDDLYVAQGNSGDSVDHIYFGGPNIDTIPDVVIPDNTLLGNPAGDVNNDGYNDLITAWSIQAVGGGQVNVYYGGPQMDGIADITIRGSELPEPVLLFGKEATGVGDIDGDGIGDFAVSAVDVFQIWLVYIFSGDGVITDVEDDNGDLLPTDFQLGQNYPNPFNPSTSIPFTLSRRAFVTISVYNVLGQRIATVLSEEVPAGDHTIEINIDDFGPRGIASGFYYYKLEADGVTLTRKMLLLK